MQPRKLVYQELENILGHKLTKYDRTLKEQQTDNVAVIKIRQYCSEQSSSPEIRGFLVQISTRFCLR